MDHFNKAKAAFVSGTGASLWLYIVGPVIGAVAGAWAYRLISMGEAP